MCSGKQKKPSKPKFKDPRLKDPEYRAVSQQLGIKNFNSANDIFQVERAMAQQREQQYQQTVQQTEQVQNTNRQEDVARVERQFAETTRIQQDQFERSLAAQSAALEAQLAAQREAQRRAEEAALRAQVPQMTSNDKNARRVKPKASARSSARRAALGTSQLRIPLSIGSVATGSPVKLNIGS